MLATFELRIGRISCDLCTENAPCLMCCLAKTENPEKVEDLDSNDCACDDTEYVEED